MPLQTLSFQYSCYNTQHFFMRASVKSLCRGSGEKSKERWESEVSKLILSDKLKYLVVISFYRKL